MHHLVHEAGPELAANREDTRQLGGQDQFLTGETKVLISGQNQGQENLQEDIVTWDEMASMTFVQGKASIGDVGLRPLAFQRGFARPVARRGRMHRRDIHA